jgi:hypothetical protein
MIVRPCRGWGKATFDYGLLASTNVIIAAQATWAWDIRYPLRRI